MNMEDVHGQCKYSLNKAVDGDALYLQQIAPSLFCRCHGKLVLGHDTKFLKCRQYVVLFTNNKVIILDMVY